MRRFMIHDGERFEISPYSVWIDDLRGKTPKEVENAACDLLDVWEEEFPWQWANDIAYSDFLKWNKLHDLDTFTEETLAEATFEMISEEEPAMDRKVVYGTMDWMTDPVGCERV